MGRVMNRISESYPQIVNNLWIKLRKPHGVDKDVDTGLLFTPNVIKFTILNAAKG